MTIAKTMTALRIQAHALALTRLTHQAEHLLIDIEMLAREGLSGLNIYLSQSAERKDQVHPDHAIQLEKIFKELGFETDRTAIILRVIW